MMEEEKREGEKNPPADPPESGRTGRTVLLGQETGQNERTGSGRTDDLSTYSTWVVDQLRNANDVHIAFGLGEEAGEVLGKLKRLERGDYTRGLCWCGYARHDSKSDHPHDVRPDNPGYRPMTGHIFEETERGPDLEKFRADVAGELGDLLFYFVGLAARVGHTVESIAAMNKKKLDDRIARGVAKGTGDNR